MDMRAWFCFLLVSTSVWGDGIAPAEYRARRAELQKSIDGVMVLFGAQESGDLHTGFFQESNFLYLSGWREPGAILMLTPKEEILFLPERDLVQERYTGRKVGPTDPDAPEKTGLQRVLPVYALQTNFVRVLESSKRVYLLEGDPRAEKFQQLAPFHERASAAALIGRQRLIKSQAEIDLIAKSTEVTVSAHASAWSKTKPGLYEYEIAAVATYAYFQNGCERSAYAPIVGSGPNSVILHYSSNHRKMDSGELVVMDAGAECSDYASDVTRTIPVNGKFTPRQREIYDIVLGAQKAAIAAVKPGFRLRGPGPSLHQIAYDYINTHGKDLHGQPLGKYFTHGLGHFVGLDVHDPGDPDQKLKAGMVITIEPGVYLEGFGGMRIEDTVVVTEKGCEVLTPTSKDLRSI